MRYLAWTDESQADPEGSPVPKLDFKVEDLGKGHLGPAVVSEFELEEGQVITFVLREVGEWAYATESHRSVANPNQARADELGIPLDVLVGAASLLRPKDNPSLSRNLLEKLGMDTTLYWQAWVSKSNYKGRWRESVNRSALVLKMLVYEETGAIVAAPTFGLPEHIGGERNWDYRYTWVRDTSFTLYALIRLGFTEEANAYVDFIRARMKDRNSDGSLQIVYTIHGGKDLEEIELKHLAGHKDSKPVRIGNGAADHLQLVSRRF